MKRVHLISLGCAKNRVDSEVMVGLLQQGEFRLVDDPAEADVIVVNTCSFIQSATEESIETVLEMGEIKGAGSCKRLVVTGCLVQRYGEELEGELPEVDHFLGTGEYHRIAEILQSRSGEAARSYVDEPRYLHDEGVPRVNSWSSCSAFLKIAEGCDHRCAFCIIPRLRGRLRSRTIPSLVVEAERLAAEGVVELNLVSQDSTAYGRDLGDGTGLGGLLDALCDVNGVEWIRLHYAYPIGLPAGLLEALRDQPKVVPYLDIPLQHASGRMLKAMRRGVTREGQERILDRVREYVPDITVRTTFIVGFPGETDEDFAELCDFVQRQRFDHLGVFAYSREEGTPAVELPSQVPEHVKEARQRRLMEIQKGISQEKLQALVGQVVPVLVEGVSEESDLLLRGRTDRQAPEVDGQVFITNPSSEVRVGQIRSLKVVQAGDYDLVGELET
ncbi:MAG: 30S ribosomal protein S12 methylthiotransferase RimO [Deltaproteobacteria bacterium]|nr:30S ribosomal protein S12 methylthiotransferase RimO [Deltaproteobacteria bacterium]MBW2252971.1 30S ribosomal protein S12 methylthiotransferase RimO [Deltaproteobacteria bacterium]